MVAVELEVMAKKLDRFGWDRDRNSAAHDRLVRDWIAALQDYPLDEIQEACRQWVRQNPRKMCNEGDIRSLIDTARHDEWLKRKAEMPPEPPAPPKNKPTPEQANEILRQAGFAPKTFGRGDE
jgi:hypothetical protein